METSKLSSIVLLTVLASCNNHNEPSPVPQNKPLEVTIGLKRDDNREVAVQGGRMGLEPDDHYTAVILEQRNETGHYFSVGQGVWRGTPDSISLFLYDSFTYHLSIKQVGIGESNFGVHVNQSGYVYGVGHITNGLLFGENLANESQAYTGNFPISLYVNHDSTIVESYLDYDVYYNLVGFSSISVPGIIHLHRWQNGAEFNLINSNPNVYVDIQADWWYEQISLKTDTTFNHQFAHSSMTNGSNPAMDHADYNIKIWQNVIVTNDTINTLIYDGNPVFSRLEKILIQIDMSNALTESSLVSIYEELYEGDTLNIGG